VPVAMLCSRPMILQKPEAYRVAATAHRPLAACWKCVNWRVVGGNWGLAERLMASQSQSQTQS